MERNEFRKKLTNLVFPIAFQYFMMSLVSASDALMLGFLEQDAMSAVSLAGQVFFIEHMVIASMITGFSIFGAQFWGKRDITSFEKVFAYVMKVTAIASFVFFIATLLIPQYLMCIYTSNSTLIENGTVYLRYASGAFLLTGISQVMLCALKNSEKALKSSLIGSVSMFLNIILNALLIFGLLGLPKLGIAGAAIATVISRIFEVAWCALELAKKDGVKLRTGYMLKTEKAFLHEFWKYTAPSFGNQLTWGIGFSMFSVIMGHLGSDAVAANSIANIVKELAACFCVGLSSGGGIMIGNALGAGELEKGKLYGQKLCRLALITGTISGVALLAISPLILHFTNLTSQANEYLKWMLMICSYHIIGKSMNSTTIGGIFCAGGDSKFGFVWDTITMWVVIIPAGFIAAFALKLPVMAVYFIISLDEFVKLPAVYRNYKKYKWVKDLTVRKQIA